MPICDDIVSVPRLLWRHSSPIVLISSIMRCIVVPSLYYQIVIVLCSFLAAGFWLGSTFVKLQKWRVAENASKVFESAINSGINKQWERALRRQSMLNAVAASFSAIAAIAFGLQTLFYPPS